MSSTAVFLTGGTGNTGQYVIAELMRRSIAVTALVRKSTSLPGCRTVIGELATIDRLAGEIENASAIVHLAYSSTQESEPILRGDILGTSLLASAWSSGPFIYSSSAAIYGRPQSDLTEDSPIDISSWYEAIKFTNEFQLRVAEQRGKRGPCIRLRPGMLVTTSERCRNLQLQRFFYRHCYAGSKFIFDSEEGLESYGCSYIGGPDFARAVVHSLNIKAAGPYNVAAGFCTWRALIETINRYAGTHADFLIRPGAEPGPGECRPPQSRTFLDVSAFSAQTGFVPQQLLEELVPEFVEVERSNATRNSESKTVS